MSSGLVALNVAPGAPITGPAEDVPVLVSVSPGEGAERMPCDICCVIDISWSMSMEAKVQAASGTVESNGLSMLDIAKHAVRTIIRSMDAKDRVSIVQFCREAQIVLPMTEMTEAGQKLAETKLDELGFGSATNLWAGIEKGFECLSGPNAGERMGHMILLTDGEVTEGKDQVMPNIQNYKMKHERLPGTICVFGFGYEIDSKMLVEIADFSDGSYAFIPDAGFVGTCFVNAISNLQVTMARDAILSLQADSDAEIIEVLGGWESQKGSDDDIRVSLGTLQYGQTKDIVVRMKVKSATEPYLFASVDYSTLGGRSNVKAEAKPPGDAEAATSAQIQHCRSLVVDYLRMAVDAAGVANSEESLQKGQAIVKELAGKMTVSPAAGTNEVAALLEDVQGQCTEALSRLEYWKKWGRHYIPSVVSAHKLQQCNNFKDPGVQNYGSQLFQDMQEAADEKFNTLPAPKQTPAQYRYLGGGQLINNPSYVRPGGHAPAAPAAASAAAPAYRPAPVQSMAAYNDRYAGCIDGASRVALAEGGECPVTGLAKGDRVLSGLGGEAEVVCVVRSRCRGGRALLTEFSAPGAESSATPLRLTPHHPVHVDGEWRFPVDLGVTEEHECEAVYSFVLRGAPSALVASVPCVALGHGLSEGAAAHPYFASPRILEDLQTLPGFSTGKVDLLPEDVVRDPETGLICGLQRISA